MSKVDFEFGSSDISRFWFFINERHRIWCKRAAGESKPWTKDEIFQTWRFTNVFRQLDRGTLALRKMIESVYPNVYEDHHLKTDDLIQIMRNIWIYRLFNLDIHANEFGFIYDLDEYINYIRDRQHKGLKVFTSAHLTTSHGQLGIDKVGLYLEACSEAWDNAQHISIDSMQAAFEDLKQFKCIGPFVAYEIVCDMRFIPGLLCEAPDILTWSNVGPGAKRGLQRLGLPPTLESMISLYKESVIFLEPHVKRHHPQFGGDYPPFELREIEHSLCELDKEQRIRLGQGRPRQKYNGVRND